MLNAGLAPLTHLHPQYHQRAMHSTDHQPPPTGPLGRPHMPDEADLFKLVNVVLYAVDTHVASNR